MGGGGGGRDIWKGIRTCDAAEEMVSGREDVWMVMTMKSETEFGEGGEELYLSL